MSKQYKILKAVRDTIAADAQFGTSGTGKFALYAGAEADRPLYGHLPYIIVTDGEEMVLDRQMGKQNHLQLDFGIVICQAAPSEYANFMGQGTSKGLKELSDDMVALLDYSAVGLSPAEVSGLNILYQRTTPIMNLRIQDNQGKILGLTMESFILFRAEYWD